MDIDSDFSFLARNFAVSYATKTYGAKAVSGIMTKTKLGSKSALTYAPKLLAKQDGRELKAYAREGEHLRSLIEDDTAPLSAIDDKVKDCSETEQKIFQYAKLIEGNILSYGQHAAGTIVIMDGAIEDFIPLMMAKDREGNDKLVIQADMVAAEAQLGFIKFDFLGLKNLNVITAAQQMILKRYGVDLDMYHLDLHDEAVYRDIFACGNTNFVFQFESDGMKSMLRQLRPTTFGDIVLAVSVYRPGPMDFIPDIIKAKNEGTPSAIVERIPVLKDVLAETYGFPVYQEQVMKIMTVCAGFSMGMADNVRRFMSKKKADKLAAVRPEFIKGCESNGIKAEDADWLFDQLMPFAKYGFNKSHAAAYSMISFITAYLKKYYPKEYFCAVMLEQGDKPMQLVTECHRLGIDVLTADVNVSDENYTVESDHSIRVGLSAVKGLKDGAKKIVAVRGERKFSDMKDFLQRTADVLKSNEVEACILSGTCDSFVPNRQQGVRKAKTYVEAWKRLAVLHKRAPSKKTDKEIKDIEQMLSETSFLVGDPTSKDIKRSLEMTYFGTFFSGSPLEAYDLDKYQSVSDVNFGDRIATVGIITNLRVLTTKAGDEMAVFTLVDKDSVETPAVIFPRAYAQLVDANVSLRDTMAVVLYGTVEERDDSKQIVVSRASTNERSASAITLDCSKTLLLWQYYRDALMAYSMPGGIPVKVYGEGQLFATDLTVSPEAVEYLKKRGATYHVTR